MKRGAFHSHSKVHQVTPTATYIPMYVYTWALGLNALLSKCIWHVLRSHSVA